MASLTPRIDRFERNLIINGNFDFWQRGTSFTSIAASTYSADRFKYLKVGSMVHNIVRSTDSPAAGSTYSASIDITTPDDAIAAGDYTIFEQRIEGYNILELIQNQFTLTFWVKAAITGTYCVAFLNGGADQGIVKEYTIDVANTWEKKTIVVEAMPLTGTWDYGTGIGLYVRWVLAAGSGFHTTPNAWAATANFATSNQVNGVATGAGSFKLGRIMLNRGVLAGEFHRAGKNIQEEFAMCQRYYEKSYGLSLVPGSSSFVSSKAIMSVGSTFFRTSDNFQTAKRVAPTFATYGWNTGTPNVAERDDGVTQVALGSAGVSEHGFQIQTGGAATADVGYSFHWTADAEL